MDRRSPKRSVRASITNTRGSLTIPSAMAVVCSDGLAAGSKLGLAAVVLPTEMRLRVDSAAVAARLREWAGVSPGTGA